MRRAALFDMDHTVLRVDSSMSWMRFLWRRGELSTRFAARATLWAAQYKLAVLDIDAVADRIAGTLEGCDEAEMLTKARTWHASDLDREVAPAAVAAVRAHAAEGDAVVLLTGGSQYAARWLGARLGFEHVLCTELEVVHGRLTGRLAQRCFGPHKVAVAERWAAEHGVDLKGATFYSDSYNDLPMLARVGEPVAVNPDVRLLRHARAQGWQVVRWD